MPVRSKLGRSVQYSHSLDCNRCGLSCLEAAGWDGSTISDMLLFQPRRFKLHGNVDRVCMHISIIVIFNICSYKARNTMQCVSIIEASSKTDPYVISQSYAACLVYSR